MKRLHIPAIILTCMTLTSCEIIGDIFKAGIWVGVIGVLAIIGLIFWVISKFR
ncbi:MAG: hypothetical protein ACK40G_16655 [Cytophagaceae bacterium]